MRSLRCICLIGLYTLLLGAAMVCVGVGLARKPVSIGPRDNLTGAKK